MASQSGVAITAGNVDITVLCSGWMSKQGHRIHNWKDRYFVLLTEGHLPGTKQRRASLYYYKRHWKIGNTHAPQGCISLHDAAFNYGVPFPQERYDSTKKAKYYQFDVTTAWNNTYPLRVRGGRREREMWANQIKAAIAGEPVRLSNAVLAMLLHFVLGLTSWLLLPND